MKFQRRKSRRAIAGIVATVIMFAILFTVGTSYFIFVNQQNASYVSNLLTATNKVQGSLAESLSINTLLDADGDVGFYANDTSALTVNMTALLVLSSTGTMLVCEGVGLPAGQGCVNSVPPLWVVVNAGKGSPTIDTEYVYVTGTTVTLKVLTARGNVYSQTYPEPATSNANTALSSESVTVNLNQFRWHALTAEPTSIVQKGYTASCNSNQCALVTGSSVTVADTLVYALGWYGYNTAPTISDTFTSPFTLAAGDSNSVVHTATPAMAQSKYSSCSGTSCSTPYNSNVASGDTLVYGLGWANQAAPSAPTDTLSDAFHLGASNSVTVTPPAPAVVQHKYLANCSSATCALAYTNPVTVGNTLVLGIGWPTTNPYDYVPLTITNCQMTNPALSVDGSITGSFSTASSGSVTLSTGNSNDIIVVVVGAESNVNHNAHTVGSVTSTGLTFAKRSAGTVGSVYLDTEVWWALASSPLNSASITVNMSGTGSVDDASIVAFGVSGANTSTPWDTNVALPALATSTASAIPTVTGVSTSNANDLILGFEGAYSATNSNSENNGAGFTLIGTQRNNGGSYSSQASAEDEIVSTTQSSISVAFSASNSNWVMLGDAIQQAAPACLSGLAIDNSNSNECDGASSCTVTLTTANGNDLVYLMVSDSGGGNSLTSLSDNAGLTFKLRASVTAGSYDIYTYYAVAPTVLSSDTITAQFSASANLRFVGLAIEGANTVSPFDPNLSTVPTATGTNAAPTVTFTTTNAKDLVLGTTKGATSPITAGASGYTDIICCTSQYAALQYKIVSSTGSQTPSFTLSGSSAWGEIGDAIQAASSTATPTSFQQQVTWDPATFSSYEATNLGNVRFCADSACNSLLYSWLESCSSACSTAGSSSTSATAWVNLGTHTITGGGGTLTIYMVFLATAVTFDDVYWGEAPNLSPTYGQYDNGANVFNAYFDGLTASSGFSVASGYTLAQSTGVTYGSGTVTAQKLTGYSTTIFAALVDTTALTNAGGVVESNFENTNHGTDSGVAGLVDSSAAASVQNGEGTNTGYNGAYFDQDYLTAGAFTKGQNQQGTASTAWLYASLSYPGTSATWYSGYVAPQLYTTTNGYQGSEFVNPISAAAHIYLGFLYSTSSGSQANMYYNWARERAYPPNGVMPSSSQGSLTIGTGAPTSVTDSLGDGFTQGVALSATNAGTTYESDFWYATASSSNPDTITATFSAAVAGSVSIYEITGYATTGLLTSSGSLATGSTTASVGSMTTNANSFVVGNVETGSSSTKYTISSPYTTVASGSGGCDASDASQGCNEYATGQAQNWAATAPFTLSASTPWVEVAMSFTPLTTNTYYSYIWYATAGGSGTNPDTIMSGSFGQSVAATVSIYEISGVTAPNSLPSGQYSTGSSSASQGSTSVSPSLAQSGSGWAVVGNAETTSTTYTAGSGGYTLSGGPGSCSSVAGCGEYLTGVGSATSVPMSISPSAPWVEAAVDFAPQTTTYYSYIWYATAAGTGIDTITATFGGTATATISLYDLNGYTTSGFVASSGSSAPGSTAAAVLSFNPPGSNPIVIGNVETASATTDYTMGTVGGTYVSVKTGAGGCDGTHAAQGCSEYLTGASGSQTAPLTLSSSTTWVESSIALSAQINPQNGQQVGGYPALAVPENVKLEWSEVFTNLDPQHRSITVFPTSVLTVGTDQDEFFENTVFFIIQGINVDGTGLVAYNTSQDFTVLPYDTPVTLYFGSMTPLATTTDLLDEIAGFQATFELSGQYSDHTLFGTTIPYPTGYITNANAATSPQAGLSTASISVTCTNPCGFTPNAKATIGWINSAGVITTLKTFTMTGSGNIPAGTTFTVPTATAGYYTIIVTDYVNSAFMTFQHIGN